MKRGIWCNGHSYHPLPSIYSCPFSPPNALAISPKIEMKVGAILSRPRTPPPRMAPIAMVLMMLLYATHCTGPYILRTDIFSKNHIKSNFQVMKMLDPDLKRSLEALSRKNTIFKNLTSFCLLFFVQSQESRRFSMKCRHFHHFRLAQV